MSQKSFDVIVLGAGITGSTLALILARQGLRTLLVDHQGHPRFALGESLLKPTVLWLRVMAARFGVDELATVAHLNRIHGQIAPTSGVKKSFGFVRHEAGNPQTVAQWWANIAVSYAEDVLEAHLYRQDIDAWLFARAAAAGCATAIGPYEEIPGSPANGRPCLRTALGEVSADYVVDCTARTPALARMRHLVETPLPLRTQSRALYTHMTGVRPFDACAAAPAPALPWHHGTLHHLLDGAWMWVIPFDNHPRSTNTLVSVGVNFDTRLHPADGTPPEAQWQALLARYPALAAQFGGATAVRPWVDTGPLQRAPRGILGERCCLLGQAAGNVDALYSRGLLNSFQCLHLLAEQLLEAVAARDFASARFAPVERLHGNLLRVHDSLVHGSYCAFRTVALTDWWLALWSLVERLSLSHVVTPLAALERQDTQAWAAAQADLTRGDCIAAQDTLLPVLEAASDVMAAYARDESDEATTLRRLQDLAAPLVPLGFDPPRFHALATSHGFGRNAQRLLDTEHALTAAVEIIDEHGGLPRSLRSSAFVNGLVRLLALRYARTDEVTLAGEPLRTALAEAIARVAIPGSDDTLLAALVAGVEQLELRRETTRAPAPTAAGMVLLSCRAHGRRVRVSRSDTANGVAVVVLTEADGVRLTVTLAGTPPVALLGQSHTAAPRQAYQ